MHYKVSASILSADFGRLQEEVDDVIAAGADLIHIDVMDGHFVPNITFGAPVMKKIKSDVPFDIHLMIENPADFIDDFKHALGREPKGDIITVHAEVCPHLHRVVQQIKESGFKAAVAINPSTSLSAIEEVVDMLDMVLVMTVNPGYSGQKFIESALKKVSELRIECPDLDIEVDGGVNADTVSKCKRAGANVLVSASYLFGSKDRKQSIDVLKN